MDLSKLSFTQVAAIIGSIGTIIGAGFTIDSRYAKNAEIESIRKELRVSLDNLHKKILENEQLKQELGNNAEAVKVLAERNKQELADIRARLNYESTVKKMIRVIPDPPQKIKVDVPEIPETKSE